MKVCDVLVPACTYQFLQRAVWPIKMIWFQVWCFFIFGRSLRADFYGYFSDKLRSLECAYIVVSAQPILFLMLQKPWSIWCFLTQLRKILLYQ